MQLCHIQTQNSNPHPEPGNGSGSKHQNLEVSVVVVSPLVLSMVSTFHILLAGWHRFLAAKDLSTYSGMRRKVPSMVWALSWWSPALRYPVSKAGLLVAGQVLTRTAPPTAPRGLKTEQ